MLLVCLYNSQMWWVCCWFIFIVVFQCQKRNSGIIRCFITLFWHHAVDELLKSWAFWIKRRFWCGHAYLAMLLYHDSSSTNPASCPKSHRFPQIQRPGGGRLLTFMLAFLPDKQVDPSSNSPCLLPCPNNIAYLPLPPSHHVGLFLRCMAYLAFTVFWLGSCW